MGTFTTLLEHVQSLLAATGAAVYFEYDAARLDRHSPARYLTLGIGQISGTMPGELCSTSVYPLAVTLQVHVLDSVDSTPAVLYDSFEASVLAPLLDADYTVSAIRMHAPVQNQTLRKLELTAELTILCGYQREEEVP